MTPRDPKDGGTLSLGDWGLEVARAELVNICVPLQVTP